MSDENNKETTDELAKVLPIDIVHEMKKSFIDYSMSVIVDRALPDVRDGLKPVHRRIIYSMFEQGYTPDKSYRKSATTVGNVMGKYHPHGDAAIYDSLVRLAQDFSMRYTLVDGNGNFGSRDGDPPAAQRYTEAKMSKISMEMVADINKNTVDFRPNYDEHEVEPTVLPSRFPNMLVNGSSGIAVGMATNIPPHNLGEVIDGVIQVMENPDITVDELMQYIKGPDFPTGANILGKQGIREAYKTGRGKIIVRSEAKIEEMGNNRHRIVVTEIPYQVNNARLVEKIAELVKDKRLDAISGLRDEYSKAGIRIVIELKRDANPNVVLNQLYKFTSMQEAFNVNMLALIPTADGKSQPQLINLKEALIYYVDHQKNVVTRRTQFDLDKALDRAHILEGTLLALDNIDEIINIIRSSKTEAIAKEGMMNRFGFTERQAQYIIDMRLGRLTGIEREKVLEEYQEKQKEIAYYRSILGDEGLLMGVIKDELLAIKKSYADERRTRIVPYEGEIDIDDLIHEQEIAVTLTHFGYVKRTPADTYKAQRRGGKGIMGLSTREEDFVEHLLITSSHNMLLFITNFGRVYSLKGYEIPDAGRTAKGIAIVNLLQLNPDEKIATMIPISGFEDGKYLLMATKEGIIKKTELKEYCNIRKGGLIALELREGDELINARLADEEKDIMLVTRKGMSIRFSEADVRSTGRASIGVRGITLREGDSVIGMDICDPENSLLIITEKGFGKRTDIVEYRIQSRGGKGLLTYKISEKTGELAGMMMVNDANDVMLITTEGVIIRIHAEDINIIGRNTSGVRLMRTTETNLIVSCAKTDREDEDPEDSETAEKPEISDGDEEGADLETLPETSDDAVEGPDTEAGRDILNKLDIE
ncbi:MAG: DNA gyrase subunit A [Clostridiales bacterium]|jgi:DNA gyrase, A subunit|nr:DNA gyrase subunit A [Clostridiales bacterium]